MPKKSVPRGSAATPVRHAAEPGHLTKALKCLVKHTDPDVCNTLVPLLIPPIKVEPGRTAPDGNIDEASWSKDDRIDACLMGRVRDRDDHAAFADLLPRISPAIDGTLFRYLPAAEIDDGRATVHCRVWEKRRLYREDRGTVRAWISGGISLNYARDWLRKNSKAPRLMPDLGVLAVAERHPSPAAIVADTDQAAHIVRDLTDVLATFPPFVQASFRMRLAGADYASIADATGRPVGTVASAVHRVRQKLLALIKDNNHPRRIPEEGRPGLRQGPVRRCRETGIVLNLCLKAPPPSRPKARHPPPQESGQRSFE